MRQKNNLFVFVVASSALGLLVLFACSSPGEVPCDSDGDCFTTEECVGGQCVSMGDDADAGEDEDSDGGSTGQQECPDISAQGRVDDGSTASVLFANVGDTVELLGESSSDNEERALSYQWSVVQRPADSEAEPNEPEASSTHLEIDVLGTYEVELSVSLEDDGQECDPDPDIVVITGVESWQEGDIRVQLNWDPVEVEPDPAEQTGTDLDVMYVHEDADWTSEETVYSKNLNADWGEHGEASLDIDQRYGTGPENINHIDPATAGTYSVGVHFHCDYGFGPADATVDVYAGGELIATMQRRLEAVGDFWHVGDITWGSGAEFDDIDSLEDVSVGVCQH